jgi:hypothetical protein
MARSLSIIINRVQCDLPITDEERELIKVHLDECEKSLNQFYYIAFSIIGIVILSLIAIRIYK